MSQDLRYDGVEYIPSNRPIWITRMKILIELTNEENLYRLWKTIEDRTTKWKGNIVLEKPLRAEQESIEMGDSDYCVDNDYKLGIVYLMKKKEFRPHSQQLNKACRTFGRKSTLMRIVCRMICDDIKSSPDDVVWPVYKKENENDVIFVTICKDPGRKSASSRHNII